MTFEEIDKRFDKGEYHIPKYPDLQHELKETYIFNENLSVKENKEKIKNHNKKIREHNYKIRSDWYKIDRKAHEKLLDDVILAIQHELGVNYELSDKFVDKYFQDSESIFSAYYDIKEDCKFFKPFMEYARKHLLDIKGE